NEMQMLLYTHPLNDRRSAQRLLPVNSVWLSGTGALEAPLQPPDSEPRVLRTLASAAFSGDWQAYARAWAQIDATALADVLARHEAGQAVRLSLCGESDAQTFGDAPAAWTTRFSRRFSPRRPLDVLGQL
ncbi:MAG: hypothetical protein JWQ72_3750, partial [Polaromonas sp.]|nr:hypothetical protein [Polaromonas sp.]